MTINYTLNNSKASGTNPTSVNQGASFTFSVTADEGYEIILDNVTATGATPSNIVTSSTGVYTITCTNATSNVVITVNAQLIDYTAKYVDGNGLRTFAEKVKDYVNNEANLLQSQTNDLQVQIETTQTKVTTLETKVSNLETKTTNLETKTTTLETTTSNLQTQTNTLQTEVNNNKKEVQEVSQNLSNLQTTVNTQGQNITNLQNNKLNNTKAAVASVGGLVKPDAAPASTQLVGVDTSNNQAAIGVGEGLKVTDNTLSATPTIEVVDTLPENGEANKLYRLGSDLYIAEAIGTFSYQIDSWQNQTGATSMAVTLNDGLGSETTNSYSSSMSSAESKTIGKGAKMKLNWNSDDSSATITTRVNGNPTVYTSTSGEAEIDLNFNDVVTIEMNASCLTGDTLITLADGTEKRIDQLTTEDRVLGYNPDTLELVSQKIVMCDSAEEKYGDEYVRYNFSDGRHVDTVHRHAFYNSDFGIISCIDGWLIGMHARTKEDTMPELVSVETFKEKVRHYTIYTEYENYFANGLLSGNRFTKRLFFDLYKEEKSK